MRVCLIPSSLTLWIVFRGRCNFALMMVAYLPAHQPSASALDLPPPLAGEDENPGRRDKASVLSTGDVPQAFQMRQARPDLAW